MSLDALGILYGTDKSSLRHGYLAHYERLLAPFRERNFNLVEIGIQRGASLALWHAYFARATIIGVDIADVCRQYARGRIKVAIGSQADAVFLSGLAAEYPPTVVIDDGSHKPEHQLFSFEHLFPLLRPGGCYIIEDVAVDAASLDGRRSCSPVEYFAQLQLGMTSGWQQTREGEWPAWAPDELARMEAFGSAVALWKSEERAVSEDLWAVEDLVRRSQDAESLLYFSEYLERKLGLLDRALMMAEEAAVLLPNNPWCQIRISSVLRSRGDLPAAITAAHRAVELGVGDPYFASFLQELRDSEGPV